MGGCPFHSTDDGPTDDGPTDDDAGSSRTGDGRGPVARRDFIKSALLVGGASAVASLGSLAGVSPTVRAAETPGIGAAVRQNRQHSWDEFEPVVASGTTAPPPNALFLMLDYLGDGEPSPGHRRQVGDALDAIERRFEWGPDGVLFTIAYSADYFDRFDEAPPAGAAPDDQESVAETVAALTGFAATNDDITPDTYDAVLLLASRNAATLVAIEAALWGDDDLDFSFDATFEGVFAKPEAWPDRRVGFAGSAFQEREETYEREFLDGDDAIPNEAPLSMGFVAGFGESIPAEDVVTLKAGQRFPGPDILSDDVPDRPYVGDVGVRDPGVFAQGTLKHLSHLEIDLSKWYGEAGGSDESSGDNRRRHQMYSPYHTESETNAEGGARPGSGLTADEDGPGDGPDQDTYSVREYADRTPETAAGDGTAETGEPTVGHSQKTARARYDVEGTGTPEQPVLRRDWDDIAPVGPDDTDRAGYHFNVPMRFNESIYTLLDATYNVAFTSLDGEIDHDAVETTGLAERNGIAPYLRATRRGNWLVPPITVRALPYPRADTASLSVERTGGAYVVTVSALDRGDGGPLDPETVRFGTVERVNKAGGVGPASVSNRGGARTFEFPTEGTGLESGATAKLFGKRRGTRKPVVGTTTV